MKTAVEADSYFGPWEDRICTLTSITRICVRRVVKSVDDDGQTHISISLRLLMGEEALALIGRDSAYFSDEPPAEDAALAASESDAG